MARKIRGRSLDWWAKDRAAQMAAELEPVEKDNKRLTTLYFAAGLRLGKMAASIAEQTQAENLLTKEAARIVLRQVKDPGNINAVILALLAYPMGSREYKLGKELTGPEYVGALDKIRKARRETAETLTALLGEGLSMMEAGLAGVASAAIGHTYYNLARASGLALFYDIPTDAELRAEAARSRYRGRTAAQRAKANTEWTAERIDRVMIETALTDTTPEKAEKEIHDKTQSGASQARRVYRTAAGQVSGEEQAKIYRMEGVEEYVYVAILDHRTTKLCRSLDGNIYKVANLVQGLNYPPTHDWCRSTTIAYLGPEFLAAQSRPALNQETGETITLPMTITYKEYAEKYGKKKAR